MAEDKLSVLSEKFRTILFFFILFGFAVFSPLAYDEYQLAKGSLITAAAVLILLSALSAGAPRLKFSVPLVFMSAFLLYIVIRIHSSPFSPGLIYTLVLCSPALFLVPSVIKFDIKKFLLAANLLVFAASAAGLAQFFYGTGRPYSFFGNPIFFAEFLMMLLPPVLISFYFFRRARILLAINTAAAFSCVMLASSRGAFAAIFISLSFLFIYLKKAGFLRFNKKMLKKTALYVLVPLITILLIPGFTESFKYNIKRSGEIISLNSPAIQHRILMSRTGIKMASEKPVFGHGAGSIKHLYEKYQADSLSSGNFRFVRTSYIHNDYIHLAAETGAAGLVLYLGFIISLIVFYDKKRRLLGDKEDIFCLALAASVIGFISESFFNFPLFIFPSAALFWLFTGIIHSACSTKTKKISPAAKPFISLALILLVSVLFSRAGAFVQDFYIKYAVKQSAKETNYERKLLPFAAGLNPADTRPYFILGLSYIRSEEYKEALSWYVKAFAARPFSADTLYNIATLNRRLKNYPEAERFYKKAVELHPGFINAYQGLGRVYMDTGREQKGIEMFAKAKKILPGYFDIEPLNMIMEIKETTYLIFDNGPKAGAESPE